jgi:N-methylhydantoinase B
MRIMEVNSRLPDFLRGDMWAGIAAARVGERRLLDVVERYGVETFLVAIDHFMDYGEQVALATLGELPKGTFSLEEEQDSGARYKVAVTITDEEFIVDLRDNPDQDNGPNNTSRDGSLVATQMVFMNLTQSQSAANAGYFRRINMLTRPGSVFDPKPHAAFAIYYEVELRLYDVIWRCLAPHLDGRLPAGSFASICGTFIGGPHPDTGRHFTIVEPQVGGWGASESADGNPAMFSGFHGDTFNCPAEVAEARYGLYVDRLSLNDEPGGEGQHRGGKGIVVEYRVRSNGCFFTCAYTRNVHKPWPMAGGLEGSPNYAEVLRPDGSVERFAVVTGLQVNEGDVIRIHTGSGGGFGDPIRRPRELVLEDLRNGFVTEERAAEVYRL